MPEIPNKTYRDSTIFLIAASAVTILISFIPLAEFVVYPLRLFVTFIHESGHALAALGTFGEVDGLAIYADASGETYTRGGYQPAIASAGYLMSTAYGASLLVLCRDGSRAKAVLTVTAALILFLAGFYARDPFSWFIGIILAIGLIVIALASSIRMAHFFLSFLAVQCCLNALFDLKTLFMLSATGSSHSDAATMQELTPIPAQFWAAFWFLISIVTLIVALRSHLPQKSVEVKS
ncbi:MAG TPA: M50 family metallopeptidase [Blastocatellia bacterium]|nr:M50 family metallopeptidase [Blastocatellia bacterium]